MEKPGAEETRREVKGARDQAPQPIRVGDLIAPIGLPVHRDLVAHRKRLVELQAPRAVTFNKALTDHRPMVVQTPEVPQLTGADKLLEEDLPQEEDQLPEAGLRLEVKGASQVPPEVLHLVASLNQQTESKLNITLHIKLH